MNFHLRNKRTRNRGGITAFMGFVALAIILLVINRLSGGAITTAFQVPASVVWDAQVAMTDKARSLDHVFSSTESLLKEREALEERILELELYAINNQVLKNENQELRNLLGISSETLHSGILASIRSRGGVVPYGTISISREAQAPYVSGAYVFGAHNIVIGRVENVSSNGALVKLLSAPGEETAVLIGSGERIVSATLVGTGSGNMALDIARDAPIELDDPVVLAGEESAIIGFVGDIVTSPTDAFQTIRVRTPLNIDVMSFVRVR